MTTDICFATTVNVKDKQKKSLDAEIHHYSFLYFPHITGHFTVPQNDILVKRYHHHTKTSSLWKGAGGGFAL
jgi:hypothetical protein